MNFKSITSLSAALFAILLAASPAGSGSMTLLGAGSPATVASLPTITLSGSLFSATGSGTATRSWTGANIGNPAYIATRRVIIVSPQTSSSRTLLSCIINGVSCDTVTTVSSTCSGCSQVIGSAIVPSGTTGIAISMTFSGNEFNASTLNIFNVDNSLLLSSTPVTNSTVVSAATSASVSVAVASSGSVVIGGAFITGSISALAYTTNDAGLNTDDFSSTQRITGHANGVAASGADTLAVGWTGSGNGSAWQAVYR